jgi:hypothetical protein
MGLFSQWQRLAQHCRGKVARRRSSLGPHSALQVEGLEDRLVLSTWFVEPISFPVDATHVHTMQEALGAAAPGDVIRIEPGASLNSVGNSTGLANGAATLTGPSAVNATTLLVSNYVAPGEIIQIPLGPSLAQPDLILSTTPTGGGQFLLSLKTPLGSAHATGTRVDTVGQLGIGKTISILGDSPGAGATFNSPIQVWGVTSGVVFDNLTFTGLVSLQTGASGTTFRHVALNNLTGIGNGSANGSNVIRESTISGIVNLTGNDVNVPSGDQILNNQFEGGTISLTHDDSAIILGNIFNDAGNGAAISVTDSQNVAISNNTVTITNGGGLGSGGAIGLALLNSSGGTNPFSATVTNNSFNTTGLGLGVFISPSSGNGSNFRAILQGNDFHYNVVGIEDVGDGTNGVNAAGLIDAGGGPLGSLGANNFRGFLTSDATAGARFAIYLNGTGGANGNISARFNLWSVSDPTQIVKDSTHNTNTGTPLAAGTGVINVGAASQQLTGDQQFVASLYNEFLKRSATIQELNIWTPQITSIGRAGVANEIIRSVEGLARLVDSYYVEFLGRPADSDGETGWVNRMVAGATEEQVIAGFLGSPEYLDNLRTTGSTPNAAFIASLYQVLLGRAGSNSEVQGWLDALPLLTRAGVAQDFTLSAEYRQSVVQQLYYKLLHRQSAPAASDVANFVNSNADILSLETVMAGSDEFYLNG